MDQVIMLVHIKDCDQGAPPAGHKHRGVVLGGGRLNICLSLGVCVCETGELSPQEGNEGGVKLQERCRVLQAGCGLQFWMGLQGKKKSQNLYQDQQSQQVWLGGRG